MTPLPHDRRRGLSAHDDRRPSRKKFWTKCCCTGTKDVRSICSVEVRAGLFRQKKMKAPLRIELQGESDVVSFRVLKMMTELDFIRG